MVNTAQPQKETEMLKPAKRATRGQIVKRTVATVAVLGTFALGWLHSPVSTHSREVDAFYDINAQARGPFQIGTMVDVAAKFKAPPGTQPNDVFSLYLPEHLVMKSKSFTITEGSSANKGGTAIAECQTTTARIMCQFSDYLATHNNVQGQVNFETRVVSEPLSNTIMWRDGLGSMFVTTFDAEGSTGGGDVERAKGDIEGHGEDLGGEAEENTGGTEDKKPAV